MAKNQELLPIGSPPQSYSGMTRKGACAAISYMLSAVLLVIFNKAALSSYNFPYVNVITLFQILCSCTFLYLMRCWEIISFTDVHSPIISYNPASFVPLTTLWQTLPLAISYLLYMLVSMESLRGISVPMYTSLRRTTVVFTMIMEYILVRQKYSRAVIFSVGIIILGAIIAGARDLSFDSYGYTIVLISNICTAVYLSSIARIGKTSDLNSFGLMWCSGIICGPILLVWAYVSGDFKELMNFPYLFTSEFQIIMLLSCVLAFAINYCVFWNTMLNSAVTQTICGNLKDVFIISLGWLVFGGLPFDLLNLIGQLIGFLGACLYAYCQIYNK